MWSISYNSIPTADNLLRRRCTIQTATCSLCNFFPETVNHLFLHCNYVHKIWSYFIAWYNIKWVQSGSINGQLEAWKFRRGRNRDRRIWPLLISPFAGQSGKKETEEIWHPKHQDMRQWSLTKSSLSFTYGAQPEIGLEQPLSGI